MLLSAKRLDALDRTDQMTPGLRRCVHEYGLPIVLMLADYGITEPRNIHHIVGEIWLGARQAGQQADVRASVDALWPGARRFLAQNSLVIVSSEPTRAMLDASMAAVSGHTVRCTKEEKHRRRLRAALRAAMPTPAPADTEEA